MVYSDVTRSSIGVELDGAFRVLIPKDTPFPARQKFAVPTARVRSGLELRFLQGESPRGVDNQLVLRVVVDRSQVAAAGRYPLLFTIYVNGNGELKVECRAQSTGRKLKIAVDPEAGIGRNADSGRSGLEKRVAQNAPGSAEEGPGTVYMLMDCSGSMGDNRLDQVKLGVLAFAKQATKIYRVGLVRFDTHASVLCDPTKDVGRLEEGMKSIIASGATNMAEAVSTAREKLKGCGGVRAMVIATDGKPTSVEGTLREGEAAKNDGILVITIGTREAQADLLKKLASRSELGKKVTSDSFSEAIASAYALLPTPKTPRV